jgi:hypothetical protein
MYKITWKDGTDVSSEEQYETLDLAMAKAKELGVFVTIVGSGFEVVGLFGVDTIANGKCPDGVEYDWNKASRIGAAKRVRV